MTTRKPREECREEVAEVAEEAAQAIEEVQQHAHERKRRLRAEIAAENRRLDTAIREGDEILQGERQ
jgi:hypothetical protein